MDFDCRARDAAPDVGAYEWHAEGGPLWTLQADFKPACDETEDTGGAEDTATGRAKDGGCGCATGNAKSMMAALIAALVLVLRHRAG